jgi:hypothetical protein
MTDTDLIRQMTKECRRLGSAARSADGRAFWLELIERWKAVESRSARQPCLRQSPQADALQEHSPDRLGRSEVFVRTRTPEAGLRRSRLRNG